MSVMDLKALKAFKVLLDKMVNPVYLDHKELQVLKVFLDKWDNKDNKEFLVQWVHKDHKVT